VLLKNTVIPERGNDMEWLVALIGKGMIFFIRYEKIVSSINTFDGVYQQFCLVEFEFFGHLNLLKMIRNSLTDSNIFFSTFNLFL
jgi:hypothetical protein